MIGLEILPWKGKNAFLITYIDLSFKNQHRTDDMIVLAALGKYTGDKRLLFMSLKKAQEFIDTYIAHLALYLDKREPPEDGWIWTRDFKLTEKARG
jgi:hypothetical protein